MWHYIFNGLLPWYHNLLYIYSVLDMISRPLSEKRRPGPGEPDRPDTREMVHERVGRRDGTGKCAQSVRDPGL